MSTATSKSQPATPLLLNAEAAAAFCGIGKRTWRTWDAGGLVPAPVTGGRAKFWRSAELADWVAAGCPSRKTWELRRGESD